MRLYQIVTETSEAATGYRYAIVTHTFKGASPHEAKRYYDAHLEADRFFRACNPSGLFDDRVRCRTEVVFAGWVDE